MPITSDNPLVVQASTLIEQRTGLAVQAQFRVNLEAILLELAQGNLARFVQTLTETPESAPGWQKLIHTLAIGETYFFRHQPYFQLLRNYILPDLIPQRRQQNPPRLNFWSAGCATGEEPYSIAISLHEYLPDLSRWVVQIVGTDINLYALQAAQKGLYRQWAFRHTSADFQLRYFDRQEHGLQLKPHIREMVSFRQNNLLTAPPQTGFDVILCCNVLLYFKDGAAQRVETNFYDALTPGGWLILGQAETLRFGRERWTTHVFPEVVAYQKPYSPGDTTRRHTRPLPTTKPSMVAPPSPDYGDAVQALRAHDYPEADRILSNLLEQNSTNASAHVLLGCLFANRQATPEALMHLDTALRLNPLQADAHYLKGMLHLEAGKTAAALEALRAAIYCQRGHPLAAMMLGQLYIEAREPDRARRTWEEALQTLAGVPGDKPVSDVSDLTTEAAAAFFTSHLNQLRE